MTEVEGQGWSWGYRLTGEQIPQWENQEFRSQCSNWHHYMVRFFPGICVQEVLRGPLASEKYSNWDTVLHTKQEPVQWLRARTGSQTSWIKILILPLISCVSLGKSPNLQCLSFLIRNMRLIIVPPGIIIKINELTYVKGLGKCGELNKCYRGLTLKK